MVDTKKHMGRNLLPYDIPTFDMALDVKQAVKLAKTLSILDSAQTKYPVFWYEFYCLLRPEKLILEGKNRLGLHDVSQIAYVLTQMPQKDDTDDLSKLLYTVV